MKSEIFGGNNGFGIDCSGFTQLIYKINGYKIDRDAKDQAKLGQVLSFVQESEPGDLAFFDNNEGEGVLQEYMGGYEDWVRAKSLLKEDMEKVTRRRKKATIEREPKSNHQPKLSKKEAGELEVLLRKIEALEQEQSSINGKLSDSETYQESPDKIVKLQIRLASIDKEIMDYLVRWDELETKKLRIENNSYS